MLGIVLCGGKSQRMGADKGLMQRNGKIWAQLAGETFTNLGIPAKYSVSPEQQDLYGVHVGKENLIIDDFRLDIKGPLLGVLSAHLSNPEEDLFLLACDLILMESRILKIILESNRLDESFDAYIFTKEGEAEPLCGIYKSAGLKTVLDMFRTSQLTKHSMKYALSTLKVCEIPLAGSDSNCFTNFNSHSEINGL